ncbi:ATP-binding protein [Flavobacterium coralii]|uniref:ATP-binding protein n=1 Tax=Flavobacterium coralii TaxID=2838017 RepID=UPI000C64664C|nr:PAS domain-containing sensor histidine kinase [Flavobacterium sp.]|tara:strand:- start:4855 stop:6570 length:1716 start_codon:yes stop_codon:yes gene_type:complete
MKIKTKLTIAVGILFFFIALLSALAIRQVHLLSDDTKNILEANYISLDYTRNMHKLLDDAVMNKEDITEFEKLLEKQSTNITEIGEEELTQDLISHFSKLKQEPDNPHLITNIRKDLNDIMKLNMDAILRKSNTAGNTADNSILWISVTSAFCFIMGFTLLVNLPGYIANPIKNLTESIKQIAAKNYSQRIYFKGHDEFASLAKSFNTMAEKLQEYSNSNLDRLMMEKKRVETLINNLSDPAIGLDEQNKILFINEQALKISGLKKEEAIGKQAEQVAVTNDLMRSLLQKMALNTKDPALKIYADNKESYFEKQLVPISIVPTGEELKKQIGSFIILRNITAYKELDAAKTNFIATVSHEFKTPIASMKMSLQLLGNEQTGNLNEEQKNLVESIKEDTDRLLRTTGELLNISQVETGITKVKTEAVEVNTVIHDAIENNRKLAEQKSITINFESLQNLPEVSADSEKATWVISNLISNAIRYSYDNTVINVAIETIGNKLKITVIDNGIGIDPKYLPRIFDKYFRVPGTEKEGTGLGLAISKEFIEAMGGAVSAKSELGEGSEFTVILPVR